MLLKSKPDENIGTVFHCIGGMLIPGGAVVALSELNVDFVSLWPVAITFGVVFAPRHKDLRKRTASFATVLEK